MYYELYIDVYWMINFMMDSLLLCAVTQILKCPVKKERIFTGGIVGSTISCLLILLPIPGILRFGVGGILNAGLMIRASLGKQSVRVYRKAVVFLYITAFLMSGILQIFRPYVRTFALFFVIAAAAYEVLKGIRILWFNLLKEQRSICEVVLFYGEKRCTVSGLWDTGNLLTDPLTNEPVCVAEKTLLWMLVKSDPEKKDMEEKMKFRYIPYHSVGGSGVMPVIRIPQMEIKKIQGEQHFHWNVENPLIALCSEELSKDKMYQIILNPNIVGGK